MLSRTEGRDVPGLQVVPDRSDEVPVVEHAVAALIVRSLLPLDRVCDDDVSSIRWVEWDRILVVRKHQPSAAVLLDALMSVFRVDVAVLLGLQLGKPRCSLIAPLAAAFPRLVDDGQ